MVAKELILEQLGESALLLPGLIEEGLAANDRLKIRLSLLQEAAAQVSQPGLAAPAMTRELRAVGLTEPVYAETISGARPLGSDAFIAPGAELLVAGMAHDLKAMMEPIEVAQSEGRSEAQGAAWTPSSRPCRILTGTASLAAT